MPLVEPPLNHSLSTALPRFRLSSHYCWELNKHLESSVVFFFFPACSVWLRISTREGAVSQLKWCRFKPLFLFFLPKQKVLFHPRLLCLFHSFNANLAFKEWFSGNIATQHFILEIRIIIPTLCLVFSHRINTHLLPPSLLIITGSDRRSYWQSDGGLQAALKAEERGH